MIQGTLDNKTVWVKQTEHAQAAAAIAEAWDLRHLPVERRALLIEATRRHDAGWEALESRGEPTGGWQALDFMTLTGALRADVWRRSVEIAAAHHPYAGLLVGLHFHRLSTENGDHTEEERCRQRALAETCADLRSQIAEEPGGPALLESAERDGLLLGLFDLLQLITIGGLPPQAEIEGECSYRLHRRDDALSIDPWPLTVETLRLRCPTVDGDVIESTLAR
jgi:Protein of unknown function (DUF3891)